MIIANFCRVKTQFNNSSAILVCCVSNERKKNENNIKEKGRIKKVHA